MIFNLANPYELDQYKEYVNALYAKKAVVEVKEKKTNRTLKQNKYLHVLLSYFACEYGCTVEEAKLDFYKRTCNSDLYVIKKVNRLNRQVETVRSSSSLDTGEMTLSIERFRNWSASVASIYLPSPQEHDYILHCEQIIEQNKSYI
jgi:hypothetical protein